MINWTRVKELKEDIGTDDFAEISQIFLEEVEGVLAKLRDKDDASLEAELHLLNGCALNLGFADFAMLCCREEQALKQGMSKDVDIDSIQESYLQSKKAFLQSI